MKQQNLANHTHSDPKILTATAIWLLGILCVLALMTGTFTSWNIGGVMAEDIYMLIIIVCLGLLPFLGLRITRVYSTKLQDRIIRQEVQFRHFVMTNKLINTRITLKQMISLRFAGDDEFLELCNKTAEQNLDPKTIKTMIKNWKGDFDRV